MRTRRSSLVALLPGRGFVSGRANPNPASPQIFPTWFLLLCTGLAVQAQIDVTQPPHNAQGDGIKRVSASIQSALNTAPAGSTVYFPKGTYLLDEGLTVPAGLTLLAEGATLKADRHIGNTAILLTLNSDTTIKGLHFEGNGGWSSDPFVVPGAGTVVGFSNRLIGLVANGRGTLIEDCYFHGFGTYAITLNGAQQTVINCTAATIGRAAFRSYRGIEHQWIGNQAEGVAGNQTVGGVTAVKESKFADGFMIESSTNVVLIGNQVRDFVRIAYCVEGTADRISSQIQICGNLAKDGHSARGTEYNAGAWVEGGHSDNNIRISGNTFENTGLGAMLSNGVSTEANHCLNNSAAGLAGKNYIARNNHCVSNWVGIEVASQTGDQSSVLTENVVRFNRKVGIEIFLSRGAVRISGNLCEDNGSATNGALAGLRIYQFFTNQFLSIDSNTFVSSANQGDMTGQLYAIAGVSGGDSDSATKAIRKNRFVFTGRFDRPYRATLGIAPCSFGLSDGRSYKPSEIMSEGGNTNTKLTGDAKEGRSGR